MQAPTTSFEDITETFELLDDWEERYRYVIELGKQLPELPEARRTSETKVDGCVSQVWIDQERQCGSRNEGAFLDAQPTHPRLPWG